MKKIMNIIIALFLIILLGMAALWLKSRFIKDPTLNVTPTGTIEAGGPEE